jgi:hypothetical protein
MRHAFGDPFTGGIQFTTESGGLDVAQSSHFVCESDAENMSGASLPSRLRMMYFAFMNRMFPQREGSAP